MKILHPQFVSNCKSSSECKFGPKKCWFLHQEDIEIAYQNAKDDDQRNDNEINYDMEWNLKKYLIRCWQKSKNVTHDLKKNENSTKDH